MRMVVMKRWFSISLFLLLLLISVIMFSYLLVNYVGISKEAKEKKEMISLYTSKIDGMEKEIEGYNTEINLLKGESNKKITLYENYEVWIEEIKAYLAPIN